ncbi:MAG: hypothetical protein PSN34_14565 [Urechidicola sp.]|nr:hypothetical protein [Urechidicola sp.]
MNSIKKLATFLLLGMSIAGYSQKHEHTTDTIYKAYIPINEYKKNYTELLTKNDTLSFKFNENDTLVLLKNYISKGVYVPYEFKDSTFLKYYKKIAFNHPKGVYSENTKSKYWKDDIRIYFSKSVSRHVKRELLKFTEEISSNIDSLKISQVKKIEDSNYIIYYKGDYEYENRLKNKTKSTYYMYWNGRNQIYKNTIKIVEEGLFNDELKLLKMKNLFLQSLGRFKFVDEFGCENYFANCGSNNKHFTTLDFEILKYHYSYGICKGTDLATFEEQHEKAKEILKKDNYNMNFIHTQ